MHLDEFHPVYVIVSEESNTTQFMANKLQLTCLQKDSKMVKNTPISQQRL